MSACQHNFFDGPPDNGTADELNSENVRAYMQVCQQVRAWKKDKENYKQPQCPTMLELIKKDAVSSQAKEEAWP